MSGDNMADFYIPPQMKQRSNFILWKLETDEKGKQRKIPYSALYNGRASTAIEYGGYHGDCPGGGGCAAADGFPPLVLFWLRQKEIYQGIR